MGNKSLIMMRTTLKNLFGIFAILLLFCSAESFAGNKISRITAAEVKGVVKLKFELSSIPKYRVFTIAKPDRLVLDFDDSALSFSLKNFSHPLFSSTRSSLSNTKKLRVVFDLKKSAKLQKSTITKVNNNKYYLIVDLLPKGNVKKSYKNPSDLIGKLIDEKTGTITYKIKKSNKLPIILIDAGHGGKDPGATGGYARTKEKNITLGYARELKRQLDNTKKFKVFLTRNRDYFIPLNGRVAKARKIKADLFISLHADSSPNRKTSGLSIYTLSETSSDKQAARLARKENKSDIIGGADFSDASGDILKTLINMSQRSTMNESAKFAEIVIKSIRDNRLTTLQRTHRFAGFRVLTAPDIPSVLIELGYLSNKKEERKLNSLKHKREVSKALVRAIRKYFGR
ncbi:MAG: N-acetylmuramoyl-L-alanine amidase [Myxococcota bacterium]|jgi:N-acetylmuramoyl-L-alanine amidase